MRLLVADDDSAVRTALRLVLEDAGHEVLQATSVVQAREVLSRGITDVVLVDAGISEAGVALWRELEANPLHEGRALLLTGNLPALGGLRDHAMVYAKPFDYAELLRRIDSLGPRPHSGQGAATVTTDSLVSTPST